MIHLSEQETRKLISHSLAYEAIKAAFKSVNGDAQLFPVVNAEGAEEGTMFSLKSASTSDVCGWKTGSYWPGNVEQGIPCHSTVIFLLDPKNGLLMATVEASEVNAYRTAAANAVATDVLARSDAETLTVFGTGHQAFYEVCAINEIRNIKQVMVVGRSKEKSEALIAKLRKQGIDACQSTPKAGCQSSDIVVTATTSQAPLFEADWVRAGTHISAMGADKIGKQELPTELYQDADLFCDYEKQSRVIGEFQHAPKKKDISEIGDVLNHFKDGRKNSEQITLFDSSGIALQDLYIATRLLQASNTENK
ncbi:ornithine cyclodeaminase [Vibrio nigripulchritudo ATCC 27043]|uniref:ornithine cyclodeaminase family protein n=1 Tax=Vibrio nigripulchritudo TaxID=28173 RepID=UPI00021C1B97|nr:ornithine cyclodeaminase family protein [Vibrio nigripulchritudo]EGU60494.1 ornithine cyclodeaminase [Vibrio nigripulchritudo ATCC 27043]